MTVLKKFSRLTIAILLLMLFLLCMMISCSDSEKTTKPSESTGVTDEVESSSNQSLTSNPSTTTITTTASPTTTAITTGDSMENKKLAIIKPTVNMTEVALGIDTTPYFGWTVTSERSNNLQTAYQIKVYSSKASAEQDAADLWDSGKIESADLTSITYQGKSGRKMQ